MIIELITDKYRMWNDGKDHVLTVTYRRDTYALVRGSVEECKAFMSSHPYGLTRIEAEKVGTML